MTSVQKISLKKMYDVSQSPDLVVSSIKAKLTRQESKRSLALVSPVVTVLLDIAAQKLFN